MDALQSMWASQLKSIKTLNWKIYHGDTFILNNELSIKLPYPKILFYLCREKWLNSFAIFSESTLCKLCQMKYNIQLICNILVLFSIGYFYLPFILIVPQVFHFEASFTFGTSHHEVWICYSFILYFSGRLPGQCPTKVSGNNKRPRISQR